MSATILKEPTHKNDLITDNDLPEGWTLARLEEVCEPPQYGWTTSANKNSPGLKLLRTTDISGGSVDWSSVPTCSNDPDDPAKYLLQSGDIVVSRAGSVGVSYLVKNPPRAVFASYLIRFRPLPLLEGKFIAAFLKSPDYWAAIGQESAGIAVPNVNASKLKKIELRLPPLAEQRRIVLQIEELLAQVNAARARLAQVAQILKRFRQAVLAAACSGRLTEEWRETNPAVEPAVQFLTKVGDGSGRSPRRKRSEVASDGVEGGDVAMPMTWAESRLEHLFSIETGATPLRKNAAYYKDGEIPWVKTGQVQNCEIWEADEFITPLAIQETNAKRFPAGTILIAMYGEGKTRGQVGRLRIDAATNQACAALVNQRLPAETVDYAYWYCQSQYNRLRQRAFGGNQPNLSLSVIKNWVVNVPPLEEQHEIVRRVEALFKLADEIQEQISAATKRADKLTQAILAKAFRGELVPTEAELARRERREYETAAELIARIKTGREAARLPERSNRQPQRPRKDAS